MGLFGKKKPERKRKASRPPDDLCSWVTHGCEGSSSTSIGCSGLPKELVVDDLINIFARFGEVTGGGLEYTEMTLRLGVMKSFCRTLQ